MIVTKTVEFPMGHRLKDHKGLCQFIHGHNYRLTVGVRGELDELGMVVDFSELKAAMLQFVKPLDHGFLFEETDELSHAFHALRSSSLPGLNRITDVPFSPTAENIAQWAFNELSKSGLNVAFVEVHESSTTSARVDA